jgi:Mannosyltransferase (PIG-V)
MSKIEAVRSTIGRRAARVSGLLPADDWLVIGWVLAVKAVLMIFGVRSYHMLEDKHVPHHLGWLEIWNRWDALHFQRLAEVGYNASDILKAWFYPLYPWCVRLVMSVTGNSLVAGFVVSGIASVVAAVVLRRLVGLDFSADVTRRAVWFFLVFPTAFYLHIGYTESLFLALMLGAMLAARQECWWLAGVLGALSWMTRANGIVLLPTLAVEAGHQWFVQKRWRWHWLWIGIVPLGFGVYLWLNWRISGDPFAFLKMRNQLFHMSFSWPWTGIRGTIGNFHRNPNQAEIVGGEELFATLLALVCGIVSWFKMRPSYAMWISGNWILLASVTFIESMPRYALTMFPIFIFFGILSKSRFWFGVITTWSILMLAIFSSLFVRGWWVF